VDVPRHVANTSVHPDYTFDAETEFGRKAPLIVEIGSGLGDAVCHAAEQNPDTDFLAVEVYTPGLANTMIKINSRGLTNVRVVEANAPEVLATMLPPGSVSELWIFFPDPWHKSRHHKRRLIQPEFAELAARAVKPGGLWRIATCSPDPRRSSICMMVNAGGPRVRSPTSGRPASSRSWAAPR
jgi:tRNA (guanine-N7-)-methyltransferase